MTVEQIREFVNGIDPEAKHYFTVLDGDSYTVWAEIEMIGLDADNRDEEEGWAFEIVRYTQNEFDDMPGKIKNALRESTMISFTYRVDVDPESAYIAHTFSCQA